MLIIPIFAYLEIKLYLYTSLILDPFLGSGQVAVISKMLGRKYLGFEIIKSYYDFAYERLEKNVYRLKKEIKT